MGVDVVDLDSGATMLQDDAHARTLGTGVSDGAASGTPRLPPGVRVGRYLVLGRLGAGGMGEVYAAYDPELDRKIALKLILPRDEGSGEDADARARLHREAQALARVDHPNVVGVHDVGVHDERVFVAMEFVDGETVGSWLRAGPRRWRDVLRVILAAGEGLAAAHARGLIHRDVKPDNIMLGADGRVRVMDLGLVRFRGERPAAAAPAAAPGRGGELALTVAGAVLGTPAYMAPEQFLGEPADARTDIFALCATAWEVIYGQRPFSGADFQEIQRRVLTGVPTPPPDEHTAPRWLRRALERGLARRPADRFPDMPALLAALRADPTRRRVRLGAVAAAVAAAATLVGWQRAADEAVMSACAAEGDAIRSTWDDAARASLERSFTATGLGFAATTFAKTAGGLDRWTSAWTTAATDACVAHRIRGELDAALHTAARDCLEESRLVFDGVLAALAGLDADSLTGATGEVASLPDPSSCTDPATLARRPRLPPERRNDARGVQLELARARGDWIAGDYDAGVVRAEAALAAATAIEWQAGVASAHLSLGLLQGGAGRFPEAEASLRRGIVAARAARASPLLAELHAELVFVVGYRLGRPAEGELWAQTALDLFALDDSLSPLIRADLDNNLAIILIGQGRLEEASELLASALAVRERVYGHEHPTVSATLSNLAALARRSDDRARARDLYEQAIAVTRSALGDDHPDLAHDLSNLAACHRDDGDLRAALDLYDRASTIYRAAFGDQHPDVARISHEVALIRLSEGDLAAALAGFERAHAVRERTLGPEEPATAASLAGLADTLRALGRADEAETLYLRSLAILERAKGRRHAETARSLHGLGVLRHRQGRYPEALALLEEALAVRSGGVPKAHAETAIALADVLWDAGTDRARARALVESARDLLVGVPTAEGRLDPASAWLAAHPP